MKFVFFVFFIENRTSIEFFKFNTAKLIQIIVLCFSVENGRLEAYLSDFSMTTRSSTYKFDHGAKVIRSCINYRHSRSQRLKLDFFRCNWKDIQSLKKHKLRQQIFIYSLKNQLFQMKGNFLIIHNSVLPPSTLIMIMLSVNHWICNDNTKHNCKDENNIKELHFLIVLLSFDWRQKTYWLTWNIGLSLILKNNPRLGYLILLFVRKSIMGYKVGCITGFLDCLSLFFWSVYSKSK